MNLLDLVTYLRHNILDDTGGQGVDWTNYSDTAFDSIQLRWTNEELVDNINEAIRRVYVRTSPIKDLITVTTVVGTYEYTLPSYVKEIIAMKRSTGEDIIEKSLDDVWALQSLKTKQGDPKFFISDSSNNSLRLYPIPIAIDTLDILIYRLPKLELTWDNPNYIPELRQEYLIPMLYGAANLCYLKDETNTLDPQRAATFSLMFDREFPFTSVYSSIRKGRTSNRPVKYGGL